MVDGGYAFKEIIINIAWMVGIPNNNNRSTVLGLEIRMYIAL